MYRDRDRQPFEREGDSTLTAIKVFLAIFLAISISWLIREAYLYWMVQQIGHAFTQSTAEIQAQTQANLQRIREQQAVELARIEQQRALAEQQKAQAELEKAKMIQAQSAAIEAAKEEERLKAQAWEKYFKPRPECENPRNNEFVACGNDYIRAKKKFEADWEAKKSLIQ